VVVVESGLIDNENDDDENARPHLAPTATTEAAMMSTLTSSASSFNPSHSLSTNITNYCSSTSQTSSFISFDKEDTRSVSKEKPNKRRSFNDNEEIFSDRNLNLKLAETSLIMNSGSDGNESALVGGNGEMRRKKYAVYRSERKKDRKNPIYREKMMNKIEESNVNSNNNGRNQQHEKYSSLGENSLNQNETIASSAATEGNNNNNNPNLGVHFRTRNFLNMLSPFNRERKKLLISIV
jgi:hypothetical protein